MNSSLVQEDGEMIQSFRKQIDETKKVVVVELLNDRFLVRSFLCFGRCRTVGRDRSYSAVLHFRVEYEVCLSCEERAGKKGVHLSRFTSSQLSSKKKCLAQKIF